MGPLRGELLKKELGIFSFDDLLQHFPYRHLDKTKLTPIAALQPGVDFAQVQGRLISFEVFGERQSKRLVAVLKDRSGVIELTWFKNFHWIEKKLQQDETYIAFGRVSFFMGKPQIVHPELELSTSLNGSSRTALEPIYPATEKLKAKQLGGRQQAKLVEALMALLSPKDLPENLPDHIIQDLQLIPRFEAYQQIHFPSSQESYEAAVRRLKFEELFITQLRLAMLRAERHRKSRGVRFEKVGKLFNDFYSHYLPFQLTGAQKTVLKEIRLDTAAGHQMNRLLQGDVGSGKTVVALLTALLAIDNGFQACLMAPTEILSQQHHTSLVELIKDLPVTIRLLTGSTSAKERKQLLLALAAGEVDLLIGTHALIEEIVQFKNLGLAIIDEQHRFGVAQRARLWNKAIVPPHVLVMTATPIPRTLAMTSYGDLDYSIMNELPPGRQPITTVHRYDSRRAQVMDFIRSEIDSGRQVYIIYPLIEESMKLDYENLMSGYENVKAFFPEPKYWISMVHGRQPAEQKETNMQRFVKHDTQIMVSTTVIEVGVNVPNATVMVIESSEKFGLSQLHQLRGRVGRGINKSYCILMTGNAVSTDARERIKIMTSTNNGFEIAEKDLEIRGPGEIEGTKQSGVLNFKLADLVKDRAVFEMARKLAEDLIDKDPQINAAENLQLKNYLQSLKGKTPWSKIS